VPLWVSAPTNSSPLPLNRPPLGDLGGEAGRGGTPVVERRAVSAAGPALGDRLAPRWGSVRKRSPAASQMSNLQE
jgi:hypothetical protein